MYKRTSFTSRSETRPFFPLSISVAKLAPCWSCKRGQIRAKSCKTLMENTHTVLNDMRDQVLHVFVRFSNPQYTNACMFIQTKKHPKSSPPNGLLCTSQPDQTRAKKAHANTWNWPCKTNWPGMVPTNEQLQTSFNILQHLASAWLSCTDRVPCDGQRCSPTPSSMSLSCPPPRNQLEPSGGAPRHLHQQWKPYQDVNCINNYKSMTSFY